MTIQAYPSVPFDESNSREAVRRIALVLNNAMRGKINAAIEFEIVDPTDSTVITDDRIHPDCLFFFDALNTEADAALRTGPFFVAEGDRGVGEATITHADTINGARFRAVILA